MHLVRYRDADGASQVGVRVGDGVVPTGHADMRAFIAGGEAALDEARAADGAASPSPPRGSSRRSTTRARCSSSA